MVMTEVAIVTTSTGRRLIVRADNDGALFVSCLGPQLAVAKLPILLWIPLDGSVNHERWQSFIPHPDAPGDQVKRAKEVMCHA